MKRKRYFVGDENKSPIYKITDDGCYYFCFIYDKWVRSLYSQNEITSVCCHGNFYREILSCEVALCINFSK